MKNQWSLILALIFALIVAIFAVINVDSVTVNYIFGEAEWPLILVIIGSALMGGIIVGSVGLFRLFLLQRKLKAAIREKQKLEEQIQQLETEREGLQVVEQPITGQEELLEDGETKSEDDNNKLPEIEKQ